MSGSTGPTRDADGYLPIEGYAVIGDGRTVALVGCDGRVDWWAVPTVASDPVISALVDPAEGGELVVAPVGDFVVRRRYLPDTIVAETTFETPSGTLTVTDSLNVGVTGRLPWTELARRIEVTEGRVRLRWCVRPGRNFGERSPWTTSHRDHHLVHAGAHHLSITATANLAATCDPHSVGGEVDLAAGERATLAVVATEASPVPLVGAADVEHRAELTTAGWKAWSESLTCTGRWVDALRRSALTLKMLIYAPGGAIVAAPTTSLPERVGGDLNWDYRFAWVRDSSFTLDALIGLGLHEEVHGAMSWLLKAVRTSDPQLAVFYTVDGELADGEHVVAAPGWRHSAPVRSGNRAAFQRQLGAFGDLFHAVRCYVDHGFVLDPETGRVLERFADWCCDEWANPDAGIWELEDARHFTASKIGCWAALDCAVALTDGRHVPDRHRPRWEAERDEIHAWVDEHCWSDALGSYTAAADGDDLDAAVLLAGRFGFDRSERLSSTIDAVRRTLGAGPLVYRCEASKGDEGAFVACSFWLASALAAVGRVDESERLLDELVGLSNDVGLYAEMIDPTDGSFLGNFPQGLSHLALIEAVFAHDRATGQGSA